jgi:VCBS repeat protein/ASPIC/UnbV protein
VSALQLIRPDRAVVNRCTILLFATLLAETPMLATHARGQAPPRAPPIRFEPVQPMLLSLGGTLVNAWADYDGDGDLDLFVGFNGAPNRLYRNDRGVLTDAASTVGVADARPTRSAAWGDFDADGDPDLLVGFAPGAGSVLRLYRNDHGRFIDATVDAGLARDSGAVRQPAWVDIDGDGDLDLFVAFRDRANALFRNENGTFRDVAADLALADTRKSVGAVWFDYDEDGDLDLYVGNMDGDANGLFRNDGGRFVDVAAEAGLAWGGRLPNDPANGTVRPCAADVDGDGHLDIFTANYGKNGLFLNRGRGKFEDVSSTWGVDIDARYDSCAFADVDHDGRLDLYVNGTVTGGVSYRDYLLRNVGDRFEDVTTDDLRALQADHGVQWADFDADGDADLALTGARPDGMHLVLRNMLPARDASRSLRILVVDANGRATRAGAEVRLFAAGTGRPLGTRLVDSGSGYDAQSDMPVHFGLATSARVDVEVIWPSGGRRTSTWRRRVSPREWRGRVIVVRTGRR